MRLEANKPQNVPDVGAVEAVNIPEKAATAPTGAKKSRKHIKVEGSEGPSAQKPINSNEKSSTETARAPAVATASTAENAPKKVATKRKLRPLSECVTVEYDADGNVTTVIVPKPKELIPDVGVAESDEPTKNIAEKANAWAPKNWEKMMQNMREMRKNGSAPVDTMGCHKCSDETADGKVSNRSIQFG